MAEHTKEQKQELIAELYGLYNSKMYGDIINWQYYFEPDPKVIGSGLHPVQSKIIDHDGFYIDVESSDTLMDTYATNFYSFVANTLSQYTFRVAMGKILQPQDEAILAFCKKVLEEYFA